VEGKVGASPTSATMGMSPVTKQVPLYEGKESIMTTSQKQTAVTVTAYVMSFSCGYGIGLVGKCLLGPAGILVAIPISYAVGYGIGKVATAVNKSL